MAYRPSNFYRKKFTLSAPFLCQYHNHILVAHQRHSVRSTIQAQAIQLLLLVVQRQAYTLFTGLFELLYLQFAGQLLRYAP